MKLSVWQQFSSNHSSRFELVGVFRQAEHAAKAGKELLEMLRAIFDWYEEHASTLPNGQEGRPSPVELALADRFGIKWNDYSIGPSLWFDPEGRGPVQVVDNLVFVDGSNSDNGAMPLDDIIRRLGGDAFVSGTLEVVNLQPGEEYPLFLEVRPNITFTLTCKFSSAPAAHELVKAITLGVNEAHAGDPLKLHIGTSEVSIESITIQGDTLALVNARIHPLYGGFARLLTYLTERGALNFDCEFFETRSARHRIDRSPKTG